MSPTTQNSCRFIGAAWQHYLYSMPSHPPESRSYGVVVNLGDFETGDEHRCLSFKNSLAPGSNPGMTCICYDAIFTKFLAPIKYRWSFFHGFKQKDRQTPFTTDLSDTVIYALLSPPPSLVNGPAELKFRE